MGPALHLIARLYRVEEHAKALSLSADERLALRQRVSARIIEKLHQYLLELQAEVLPKSPSGAAVRYALNQWKALTRFLAGRRVGDRQRRHGTSQPPYYTRPRQLDFFR
jgi:transposase